MQAKFWLAMLVGIHLCALGAHVLAPYGPATQHREHAWCPPSSFRWQSQGLHVHGWQWHGGACEIDTKQIYRVQLGWHGEEGWRLVGVAPPGRLFLLGTDGLGRDQFSRLLFGARVSLFVGVLGAFLSVVLGGLLGMVAGYYGCWADTLLMRASELFLALPWMYLLLAARAYLPLDAPPLLLFTGTVLVLGLVGWARPARLTRGVVAGVSQRDYVRAARGFGASHLYVIRAHVLPEALPVLLAHSSIAVPQFILAEATLSFLGLGFADSYPSWGNLLAGLLRLEALSGYWWLMLPLVPLVLTNICYYCLARSWSHPIPSGPVFR